LALNLPPVLQTDASGRAWGAALFIGQERYLVGDQFNETDRQQPIHVLELWAVERSLEALGSTVQGCFLDLFTDNEIVRHTLLRGSAEDPTLRAYSKQLLLSCSGNSSTVSLYASTAYTQRRT